MVNNIRDKMNIFSKMYLCENGYVYAMRSLFKNSPVKIVTFLMMFSLLLYGLAIRICE